MTRVQIPATAFIMKQYKIDLNVKIGHIHLTVSDLNKSLKFYKDILGFEVQQDLGEAIFLSAGEYHHTIGLNSWSRKGARKPEEGQIGLYHFAVLYSSRKELAKALKNLIATKYPIEGASDHGVSESIYLKDPDGNGIEIYADRKEKSWPRDKNGKLIMYTRVLDINNLLKEAV